MRTQPNDPVITSHASPLPSARAGSMDARGFHIPRSVREEQASEGKRRALDLLRRREEAARSLAAAPAPGGGSAGGDGSEGRGAPRAASNPVGALRPDERRAVEAGWLKAPQVAKRLNLEVKYVYRLIKSGRLAATNFGSRMWRVREDELLRFIGERSRVSLDEVEAQWREEEERSRKKDEK